VSKTSLQVKVQNSWLQLPARRGAAKKGALHLRQGYGGQGWLPFLIYEI